MGKGEIPLEMESSNAQIGELTLDLTTRRLRGHPPLHLAAFDPLSNISPILVILDLMIMMVSVNLVMMVTLSSTIGALKRKKYHSDVGTRKLGCGNYKL